MNRFAKFAGAGVASLAIFYKTRGQAFTKDDSSSLKLEMRPATDLSQLKLFSVTDNTELAKEIAFYLNTRIGKLQVLRNEASSEPKVNVLEDVSSKVIYLVCSFNPTQDTPSQSIQDLLSSVSAVKAQLPSKVNVVLPYFGGSAQDESLTEESLSKVLEDAGVDKVFTVNLNENRNGLSFNVPTVELDANRLCASYFKNQRQDLVIVYENEAMESRVNEIKRKFEKEGRKVEVGFVKREGDSELNYLGESLEGRDVLVVDNIVDSGKSVYNVSRYLKTLGAKNINMFAIHGVLNDESIDFINYSPINELVITNTLPMDMNHLSPKVNQVSVAKMFADIISQTTFHKNLQELYKEIKN